MNWWNRKKGINTETKNKLEAPEGVWHKCGSCKKTFSQKQYKECWYTCPECNFHDRIGSKSYFELFFDEDNYEILFCVITNLKLKNRQYLFTREIYVKVHF